MKSVLKYRIAKIITSKFNCKEIDRLDSLQMNSSYQFEIDMTEFIVLCKSRFEYKADETVVMELELRCYFKVEEECFRSLVRGNVLTLEPEILQYLATIAVGTARGEIHARCEMAGSPLQNIVLPPINLTKIITAPSEYSL